MMTWYVAVNGRDTWSGLLPEPNAEGTDGPLGSLVGAQQCVRAWRQRNEPPSPLRVLIRGGRYELSEPLVFGPEDAGLSEKRGGGAVLQRPRCPVTYAAYPGETPVFSGGRRITGFKKETVHGQAAWIAELPEAAGGLHYFRQLWVDGRRAPRPTLPRQGEYQVAEALEANFTGTWAETVCRGTTRFRFAPGDLSANWTNLTDVELSVLTLWVSLRVGIQSIDETERIVTFDRNSTQRLTHEFTKEGAHYTVENVFEALEVPGEWYFDRPLRRLVYLPRPGEQMQDTEVVAPLLTKLLVLDGTADLVFEGLTFAHTEWTPPADYACSRQGANVVPAAVSARHSQRCAFQRCQFVHLGTYGIELEEEAHDVVVAECRFDDLGAGGVKIWHGCRRNTVADCDIGNGGWVYPSAIGVLIGNAAGNQVVHNHIHDLFYSGVSVGWTWGYADSMACGNVIEWNHIHDLGKGRLSDMGGIYTLGVQPGTRLRYNLIHDITSRTYGGWCIYPDEGSSELLIENNLGYRTNNQIFHQHFGRANLVRNNIFAYGLKEQIAYSRVEEHCGFEMVGNIILYRDGVVLGPGHLNRDWPASRAHLDRNLYWREGGPVEFEVGGEKLDFAAWQAAGHDRDGRCTDPGFADPARGDFRLKLDSPALSIGFVPFDLAGAGPRTAVPGGAA
jgi:hypothetical protein